MKALVLPGRILFSLLFILSGFHHFSDDAIEHGAQSGVPFASAAVPFAGILSILGGLSIAAGFKARLGALLLILFLVPVTVMMHDFWTISDPMQRQLQYIMFMKNVSMLGAALCFAWLGPGPYSMDAWIHKKEQAD